MSTVYLILNFFFVQNLLLVFGLGLSPALKQGQAFRLKPAEFFASAVMMLLGVVIAWSLNLLLVNWLGLTYLRTLIFVLVLIILLYGTRAVAARFNSERQAALAAIIMPVNMSCAAMGLMVLCSAPGLGIVDALMAAIGGILGFGAAFFIYGEVLERMDLEWVPKPFRGLPMALICLGLIALVFLSISSLLLPGIR